MKLQLPNVTLVCIDCTDADLALKVLEICKSKADFGDVKLLTSIILNEEQNTHKIEIDTLKSLVMYSVFCLTELYKYIDTTHLLIVQRDGFILNPQSFKMEWLELDYIAPLFVQMDIVGSGGFSLRSKRIMEYAAHILPKWNGTEQHANELQKILGYYEDGVVCLKREFSHFKFATKEQASEFGQGGNRNPEYFNEKPFGFHRTWQTIDFETGVVDSTTTENTLKNSYSDEIEKLIQ